MAIEHKVRQVEELFDRLDFEISNFKSETKLHCLTGCGKCCSNPEIDASPLEFLPWALHLFLNGKAEETLLELNNTSITTCHIYRPLALLEEYNGSCSNYRYRGLICRLFGYAANRDKYGKLRLATCKIIKEDQSENFNNTEEAISKGLYVPIFTDYYMQLTQIDYHLASIILPINQALKMAIEEVLQYYAYRPFPDGMANIA
ncbi:YkgJ family cysteine cluster protein [Flavobacterium cellulosilyticum]|uniref:YkgJ family cysteine cluster protein n=1 Tax=Flavobacterium cellulosilyticum TaxID=2541731 RepID=A0A4R5CJ01_9FLAO|nr:YkgJ family cysteine cluster protein [Flavobacterium cellulosilyticum]TDD97324.1 YkgJ family cysteine cluster protein [Flavobacterium cellulosilyticum]